MAWWSLAIVTIYFFAPGFGRGPEIAAQDVPLRIPLGIAQASIQIPFTGPLRLLAESGLVWAVIWAILLITEQFFESQEPKRTWWRNDLIYAFRPYFTGKIAERLAYIVLGLAIASALATALLPLLSTMIAPFITNLIGASLASQLMPLLADVLQEVIRLGATPSLVIFCLLVLNVNRALRWEAKYRLERDLERNRHWRRESEKQKPSQAK